MTHRSYPHDRWCLIWPFFRDKHGRGVLHQEGEHYAHRLMCKLVKGEPPTPGHGTAHSCGAGHLGCVNPHHLSWKTQAENLGDCAEHGTQPKNRVGARGHFSKHEVEQIRRLLETHTHLAIARMYRVTESTISDIARGRYYAREPKLNFWTPEEDAKIKDCMERGLNFRQMAAELGRPMPAVTGRAYRIGLRSGVRKTGSQLTNGMRETHGGERA
jgi:hypothetical protein